MARCLFEWHSLIAAIQFLTRIPVPGGMHRPGADMAILHHSLIYFPLVGGGIAGFTGMIFYLSAIWWTPLVSALLALAAEALLTGGFHEDAVADSCDAFGGGWTKDDVLRIMKDSRVGSYGALGLILAVTLRASLIAQLNPQYATGVVIVSTIALSGALGRWTILLMRTIYPTIPGREGLSKDIAGNVTLHTLMCGTLTLSPFMMLSILALDFSWQGISWPGMAFLAVMGAASAAGFVGLLWAKYAYGRLQGLTGDVLGCGCYLGQLAALLVMSTGSR